MVTDHIAKPSYKDMKKPMEKTIQKQVIITRMTLTLLFALGINIIAVLFLSEIGVLFSRVNGYFIAIIFMLLNGLISVFNLITQKERETGLDSPDRRNVEAFSLLAGGIAHDFNNILTTISGCISISLLDIAPGTELREDLETALKATERASGLTTQLLRFSKGGEPIKKSASLQDIITDSTRFVLAGSGVAVEFNFPEMLPEIQIDPDQISQVIQNIVLNGKQAMKNQGHITVTVEISTNIISKQDTTYLCISIADSGPGIDPTIRHKIMKPYFTTKTKGNGLGLASSVNIIKNHHGMMDFSSVVGQGTVFRIYLPVES